MTRRARGVLLAIGIVLVPVVVWFIAVFIGARQEKHRTVVEQLEMQSLTCLDEQEKKYSQGALVRTKEGKVLKCDHGKWVDPSKLN